MGSTASIAAESDELHTIAVKNAKNFTGTSRGIKIFVGRIFVCSRATKPSNLQAYLESDKSIDDSHTIILRLGEGGSKNKYP